MSMASDVTTRKVSSALSPTSALHLDDVIIAPATASGPGARAILRVTGPQCWSLVRPMLIQDEAVPSHFKKGRFPVRLQLHDFYSPLPITLQLWPGPRTYTGQDIIELHTIGSPPLTQALLEQLITAGARLAKPGEFTLRAFLGGKLDLTQAEAVLAMTSVTEQEELKTALAQLAGGLARPLENLRDELLYVLAEVEAGLDFVEEDISFIAQDELVRRLERVGSALVEIRQGMHRRRLSDRPFRIVLAGAPNAGKSSLFNALVGSNQAIVSEQAGTTRDYVTATINIQGIALELIDTAGLELSTEEIEASAQTHREEQLKQADLVLVCADATQTIPESTESLLTELGARAILVLTHIDQTGQVDGAPEAIQTSSKTGAGLATLRMTMADYARKVLRPSAVAPSVTRCAEKIDQALESIERATELARTHPQMELVASELRIALDAIGTMVGSVYTEDLLDRIFSQFCIGK